MNQCFVIQPFDERNDKLYDEVYKEALEEAGVEPYRVDQDPTVAIPIDDIEQNIRASAICLADITTNNPNVWYELGFAFAVDRPVVMTCANGRSGPLPFDIQHRTVISYDTSSPSDFAKLRAEIVNRVQARLEHAASIQQLADEPIAPQEGVSQVEVMVLAVAAASMAPESSASIEHLKRDAERSGLTSTGFHVAVRRLTVRGFVTMKTVERLDMGGEPWPEEHIELSSNGWNWIDSNESLFLFMKRKEPAPLQLTEDDIPF